ncbi:MAG TPA: hypothetical protein VF635_17235 [Propionibacteriaceae bacterium]
MVASRWAPKSVLFAGGIGAGLTVSAVTDTSTLGRLLSAVPYNRAAQVDAQRLLNRLPAPQQAEV